MIPDIFKALKSPETFRFSGPHWYANMRERRGHSGMGPGHNATTAERSSVVGTVVGKSPAISITSSLPTTPQRQKLPLVYVCAHARARTWDYYYLPLCRCGYLEVLDFIAEKPTTVPTTVRFPTVVALWAGLANLLTHWNGSKRGEFA